MYPLTAGGAMMDVYYAGIDVSARTLDSALALTYGRSIRPRVFRSHRTLQLGRGLGFTRASALRGDARQP